MVWSLEPSKKSSLSCFSLYPRMQGTKDQQGQANETLAESLELSVAGYSGLGSLVCMLSTAPGVLLSICSLPGFYLLLPLAPLRL